MHTHSIRRGQVESHSSGLGRDEEAELVAFGVVELVDERHACEMRLLSLALSRVRARERAVFLGRASVEYEVLVAGLTHQVLEEREDLERHREDQDFVAVLVPEV